MKLAFLLATLAATGANACGLFDMECIAKHAIEDAAGKILPEARDAFEQAMDHLFQEDIGPMIDHMEAAIEKYTENLAAEVNKTVDHMKEAIEDVIDKAVEAAEKVKTDVEEIISQCMDAVATLEKTFYKDASDLLTQINAIVDKLDCMEQAAIATIRNDIQSMLSTPGYRFTNCWRSLKVGIKSIMQLTDIELYTFQKCKILENITPSTPIEGDLGILFQLAQGQKYSTEYYCMGEQTPAFQDVFTREWTEWGSQYNAWRAAVSLHSKPHHTPTTRATKTSLRAAARVETVSGDDCGTPTECYQKGMQAYNDAVKLISDLQAGVAANEEAINKATADLTSTIDTATTEIDSKINSNADAISANTAIIHKNDVTKMKAAWCECEYISARKILTEDRWEPVNPTGSKCETYEVIEGVCPDGKVIVGHENGLVGKNLGYLDSCYNEGVAIGSKCCRPCFKSGNENKPVITQYLL